MSGVDGVTQLTRSQKKNRRKKLARQRTKEEEESKDEGMVVNILESMITPGVDNSVIKMLNIIFACLFLVLLLMVFLVGSVHYCVMLFFAGGLFFSIQFFLLEAAKNPHILNPKASTPNKS